MTDLFELERRIEQLEKALHAVAMGLPIGSDEHGRIYTIGKTYTDGPRCHPQAFWTVRQPFPNGPGEAVCSICGQPSLGTRR